MLQLGREFRGRLGFALDDQFARLLVGGSQER